MPDFYAADLPLDWPDRATSQLRGLLGEDKRLVAVATGRLGLTGARSLDDIGKDFGLSRERIRQVQVELEQALNRATQNGEDPSLKLAVRRARAILGSMAPIDVHEARSIALPGASALEGDLVLHLAGPYSWSAGCLLLGPNRLTRAALQPICDAFGVIDAVALDDLLDDFGVVEHFRPDLIASSELFTVIHSTITLTGRSVNDKAAAALSVHGSPMPVEDILRMIGGNYSVRSLANQLSTDTRIVRTDRRSFGLAIWGLEEYSGIAQEIVERIERAGGAIAVEALVEDLTSVFDVKESSVRTFIQTPRFVVAAGHVRLRTVDERPVVSRLISRVKGAYVWNDRVIWHLVVDGDVLRGSGRSFPNDLAGFMRLGPGDVRRFEGPDCALTITWRDASVTGASISSLRGLMSLNGSFGADDARLGRVLRIEFALASDTYSYELLPVDTVGLHGSELVRTLTGLPIPVELEGEDLLEFVARSLEVRAGDVKRALRNRDDLAVAEALVSSRDTSEVDEVAERLAELLMGLD